MATLTNCQYLVEEGKGPGKVVDTNNNNEGKVKA